MGLGRETSAFVTCMDPEVSFIHEPLRACPPRVAGLSAEFSCLHIPGSPSRIKDKAGHRAHGILYNGSYPHKDLKGTRFPYWPMPEAQRVQNHPQGCDGTHWSKLHKVSVVPAVRLHHHGACLHFCSTVALPQSDPKSLQCFLVSSVTDLAPYL